MEIEHAYMLLVAGAFGSLWTKARWADALGWGCIAGCAVLLAAATIAKYSI